MALTEILTVAAPAVSAALQLAAAGVKKAQDANNLNTYIDRAALFNNLFNADQEKAAQAWTDLFQMIGKILAAKGITPSLPWTNEATGAHAPVIKIPVATLRELLDAATR